MPKLLNDASLQKNPPSYQKFTNYKQIFADIENQVKKNYEFLKKTSFEINMLESALTFDDVNIIMDSMVRPVKKIRVRRCIEELEKDLVCPFKGCDKNYASRSSLKLHIKNHHSFNQPLKKNCEDVKTLLLSKCSKHDFVVDKSKIISKRIAYTVSDDDSVINTADLPIFTNYGVNSSDDEILTVVKSELSSMTKKVLKHTKKNRKKGSSTSQMKR